MVSDGFDLDLENLAVLHEILAFARPKLRGRMFTTIHHHVRQCWSARDTSRKSLTAVLYRNSSKGSIGANGEVLRLLHARAQS